MPRPHRPRRPRPIPPDPEGENERRSQWAAVALESFINYTNTERPDALADLLCDLKHWCDRHDTSFMHELRRAERMYREETLADMAQHPNQTLDETIGVPPADGPPNPEPPF